VDVRSVSGPKKFNQNSRMSAFASFFTHQTTYLTDCSLLFGRRKFAIVSSYTNTAVLSVKHQLIVFLVVICAVTSLLNSVLSVVKLQCADESCSLCLMNVFCWTVGERETLRTAVLHLYLLNANSHLLSLIDCARNSCIIV